MTCPNCKQNTYKYSTVEDDEGNSFTFCPMCPKQTSKPVEFPAIIGTSKRRGRPRKEVQQPLTQGLMVAPNSPEVIARNRALAASSPKVYDTPQTRERDRSDKPRHTVGYMSDAARGQEYFHAKIAPKFDAQFGRGNWKIVKQDGMNITAEKSS